jgi:hypothetical protein
MFGSGWFENSTLVWKTGKTDMEVNTRDVLVEEDDELDAMLEEDDEL